MAWQIQCKQHFLKQLYTLNNQLESEETLTWHEDVQMYCWDCIRVRGAMFCCWICMRVYEFLWELLREVLWELLRFCDSSCWRCESCWGSVIQVVEGVRDVWCSQNILWYIWELCEVWESFLLLVQYSLNTSQNRQNMHMTRQQTWPHKHNHC